MYVDLVLRESTRAFTATFPNSVSWLFGIFSVSSRSRSVDGFHSTDAAFTWYTTDTPPRRDVSRTSAVTKHWYARERMRFGGVYPGNADLIGPCNRRHNGSRRYPEKRFSPQARSWYRP